MQKSFNQITEASISYVMMQESILLEDRLKYLKDNTRQFDISHDDTADVKDHAGIIDHFAEHGDPTKNKKYTQYALSLYKNKGIKQEDAYKLHSALSTFDAHQHKLPVEKRAMSVKNYPTLDSVVRAVEPFKDQGATKKQDVEMQHQKLAQNLDIPGHEKVYEDDHITIHKLTDKDVSKKLYARSQDSVPGVHPTEWCTATGEDKYNRFDQYSKDCPLHVIHRKSDGEVFQYHTETNSFMDRKDNSISDEDFMSVHKSLHKAWREKPELVSGEHY